MNFEYILLIIETIIKILGYTAIAMDISIQIALVVNGRILEVKYRLGENESQEIEYTRTKTQYTFEEKTSEMQYTKTFKVECVKKNNYRSLHNVTYIGENLESAQKPTVFKMYNNGKWTLKNWIPLKNGCRKAVDDTFMRLIEQEENALKKDQLNRFRKRLRRAYSTKSDVEKRSLGAVGIYVGLYGLRAKKAFLYMNKIVVEDQIGLYEIKQLMSRYMTIDQINESHYAIKVDAVLHGGKRNYLKYLTDASNLFDIKGEVTTRYIVDARYDEESCLLTELEYYCVITVNEICSVDHFKFKIGDVKRINRCEDE